MREGVPALPDTWCWATLNDLVRELRNGLSIKPMGRQGVRILRISSIRPIMKLDLNDIRYLSKESIKYDEYVLRPEDLLFTRYNGTREYVGICAEFPFDERKFLYPDKLIRVRLVNNLIDSTFIGYAMNVNVSRKFVTQRIRTTAGQAGISGGDLRAAPIPIAPLGEQRRIVAEIDDFSTRIENAISLLTRVQGNLKRYLATVLRAAVTGRLVPIEAELARAEGREYEPASVLLQRVQAERRRQWDEAGKGKYKEPVLPEMNRLPQLPEGWCWASVDMVGDVLLGRQRAPQYLTGRHARLYLRVANIKDDRIDYSDIESMDFDKDHFDKYRLEPGDILVSEGQSPELVGQSAVYRGSIDGLCFQKTLHRFRPFSFGPSSAFVQLVFRSHVRTGMFKARASITTNIAHLTLEKFKACPFPLPPAAEQSRIVEEAERLLSVATELEAHVCRQRSRLDRLRQSMLKWAFEGKLVDQDPSDEPAAHLLERIQAERGSL